MDISAITSLEKKIIKSEENLNGIVDLLHCIEVPNEEIVSTAVSAVGRVFFSLLERHYS